MASGEGPGQRADDYDLKLWKRAQDRGGWEAIAHLGLTEARIELGVTPVTEAASVPMPERRRSRTTRRRITRRSRRMVPRRESPPRTPREIDLPVGASSPSPTVENGLATPAPEDTLFRIVRRLEELEREVQAQPAESLIALIDQAVEVLGACGRCHPVGFGGVIDRIACSNLAGTRRVWPAARLSMIPHLSTP